MIKILILLVCLTGCATTKINKYMGSWVGCTENQLVLKCGAPTRVTNDGNEGKILVYDKLISYGDYGTKRKTLTKQFYINKEGKIYHWYWKGFYKWQTGKRQVRH